MTEAHILPSLAALLSLILSFDVATGLITGQVYGKEGTITRAQRPQRFWGYIASHGMLLAGCFGYVFWGLFA